MTKVPTAPSAELLKAIARTGGMRGLARQIGDISY
jgi:molybdenum-dependent DNA-binding transcriptional regulator ModE